MGLYATSAPPGVIHEPVPFVFYFMLMFMVQLVLLNVLIAIMTSAHDRIHVNARMVARYQRARLILELETRPTAAEKAAWRRNQPYRTSYFRAWSTPLANALMLVVRRLVLGPHEQPPRPRWLHMLTPDQHGGAPSADAAEGRSVTEQMLTALQRQVSAQQSGMDELQRAMADMASGQKALAQDVADHIEASRRWQASTNAASPPGRKIQRTGAMMKVIGGLRAHGES